MGAKVAQKYDTDKKCVLICVKWGFFRTGKYLLLYAKITTIKQNIRNKMGMMTEPFIYGVEENKQYNGIEQLPTAVAGEEVRVVQMLDDNKALATEGEFLPDPVVEEDGGSDDVIEEEEPIVEPQEPTTEPDPVVEPQEPVVEPDEPTVEP